ncbi:hypothetical protein THAOC_15716, partial [Thalassiosira oceanica]
MNEGARGAAPFLQLSIGVGRRETYRSRRGPGEEAEDRPTQRLGREHLQLTRWAETLTPRRANRTMSAGNPGNRRGGGGGGMIRLAPSPRDVPSIGAAALSPRSAGHGGNHALSPTAARRRMNAAAAREAGTGRGGAFWSEGHPEFYAAEVPAASDPPGRKEA